MRIPAQQASARLGKRSRRLLQRVMEKRFMQPFAMSCENLRNNQAERTGFEPADQFPSHRFSKPALSTTQPPLQNLVGGNIWVSLPAKTALVKRLPGIGEETTGGTVPFPWQQLLIRRTLTETLRSAKACPDLPLTPHVGGAWQRKPQKSNFRKVHNGRDRTSAPPNSVVSTGVGFGQAGEPPGAASLGRFRSSRLPLPSQETIIRRGGLTATG